jgi:hypothetical protein
MTATVRRASVGSIHICLGTLSMTYTDINYRKQVYRHNNWPIGLLSSRAIYQPADCVPGTLTTNHPTCLADGGKLYVKNGLSCKVYCDVTTNLGLDGMLFPLRI